MTPRPAPTGMSSDTSRSAQIVELIVPRDAVCTSSLMPRRSLIVDATRSPRVRARPVRYFLVTLSSWMARDIYTTGLKACTTSDDIGEVLVHLLEHHERRREQHERDRRRHRHDLPVGGASEHQRRTEPFDDGSE